MLFVWTFFQLLATVLSQSAKAKEHLMEQSKSVDQPPGRPEKEDGFLRFLLLLLITNLTAKCFRHTVIFDNTNRSTSSRKLVRERRANGF